MNLARATLLIGCLCAAVASPAAAAHSIESIPTPDGVSIDGLTEDWDGVSVAYLEDSLRVVGIRHDDVNLYLMYRFGDARLARQLLDRGVLLWINGDGKKKTADEAFGVRYAGSEDIAQAIESEPSGYGRPSGERGGGRGGFEPPAAMTAMRPKADELVVIRDGLKETVPTDDASSFGAASAETDGVFAYELEIPFAEIGGKVADRPSTKPRKLAVGVQVGGLTEAEQELVEGTMEQMREERGGRGGGMGGRGGGMGGMGGRGGGMGGRGMGSGGPPGGGRPSLDADIDWLVVTLPASVE